MKLCVLIINIVQKLFCSEEKLLLMNLLNQFLMNTVIAENDEKIFFKNLVTSTEENERLELTNICWICDRLIKNSDNKVRDHCHITGKYTGAAHYSCNINLKIRKKVPVLFQNLKGYDSHSIFKELGRFDIKISVIPNRLEKYMSFTINKNVIFIDSMQFMNCNLDKLAKNLSDKDFKYLSEEYSGEQLKLVKEKCVYPYEYMNSFKKLINCLIKIIFLVH